MNNNYEQNEKKFFQEDKGFSINKPSFLEIRYYHPQSKGKDDASIIEITLLSKYHPDLVSYKSIGNIWMHKRNFEIIIHRINLRHYSNPIKFIMCT